MNGTQFRRLQPFLVVLAALAIGLILVGPARASATALAKDKASEASVTFKERNDSGLTGTATLKAKGSSTVVSILVDGAVGDHPTHIHQGTCADLDPNPQYPLNNVELRTTDLTGLSDTTVDVPLSELLDTDHIILIHKSLKEIGTYYACGDIVAGPGKHGAAGSQVGADNPLGTLGSGSAGHQRRSGWFGLIALSLSAIVISGMGIVLYRRAPRRS